MKVSSVAGLLLVAALTACGQQVDVGTSASLVDMPWTLSTMNGQPVSNGVALTLPEGKSYSALTLELDGKNMTGYSGCNIFNGTYTATGNDFAVAELGTIQKVCPDAIRQQKNTYLQTLAETVSYEISGETLTLFNEVEDAALIYRK